jgi:DNA-binding GntR family transcriptional regulator
MFTVGSMVWGDRADRINHTGPRFVWEQIAADIAADIASGELAADNRLPPEDALAEVYGVSRPTVRRAIASLVEKNLLVVRHGRGTFVSATGAD